MWFSTIAIVVSSEVLMQAEAAKAGIKLPRIEVPDEEPKGCDPLYLLCAFALGGLLL